MNTEIAKKDGNVKRPPVVVVLGHVDHGKTKILDYIRKTKVAESESGGITQHIGAYQIEVPQEPKSRESEANRGIPRPIQQVQGRPEELEGRRARAIGSEAQARRDDFANRKITFLDTPGHEAFSAIRSRGAKVADIAILVVAAEDGVKPQTKEAIRHIQAAEIPFIVALNKIDKPEAKPAMAKQQLAEAGVLVEGLGGQIPAVETSAKSGKGIDELLELLLLTAELENLETNPDQPAKGVVIESHLDPRRGCVATLLVQEGTLRVADYIVSGSAFAKIKLLEDFAGKTIKEAKPSQPVLTLGWSEDPDVGREFKAVQSKEEAEKETKQALIAEPPLFAGESAPDKESKKILNVVFKADTRSSLEALNESTKNIGAEEVAFRAVGYGIGNIKDTDIQTAANGEGTVYGFHVEVEDSARRLAEKQKVAIKTFKIIYELIEELRKDLSGLLEPEVKIIPLGKVRVLKLFKSGSNYQIVGGKVVSGYAKRGALIDVLRNGAKMVSGRLSQLQHNKADVEEVKEGLECGIRFEGPAEIQEGDTLEIYEEEKIRRSI